MAESLDPQNLATLKELALSQAGKKRGTKWGSLCSSPANFMSKRTKLLLRSKDQGSFLKGS